MSHEPIEDPHELIARYVRTLRWVECELAQIEQRHAQVDVDRAQLEESRVRTFAHINALQRVIHGE